MIPRPIMLLAVAALLATASPARALDADSLAYSERVRELARTHPALAADWVSSAQSLADQGLYGEALLLLQGLQGSEPVGTAAEGSGRNVSKTRLAGWDISAGVDYYRLQDVDTVRMTDEEVREYLRLTAIPLTSWVRLGLEMRQPLRHVDALRPAVRIASQRSRFELPVTSTFRDGAFRNDLLLTGEKWYREGPADDSTFAPFEPQPSDMLGARDAASMEIGLASHSFVKIPLEFAAEMYRRTRPGYESFLEYSLAPEFRHEPGRVLESAALALEARHRDYRGFSTEEEVDSLDVFYLGCSIDASARAGAATGRLSSAYLGESYPNRTGLSRVDRLDTRARLDAGIRGVDVFATVSHIYERELQTAALDGHQVRIAPGVRFRLGHFAAEPSCRLEQRTAGAVTVTYGDTLYTRYLWDNIRAYEPALHVETTRESYEAVVELGYRFEDVDAAQVSSRTDSRAFLVTGTATIRPAGRLSIQGSADYQFRRYVPFSRSGRTTENLSLSAVASVAF